MKTLLHPVAAPAPETAERPDPARRVAHLVIDRDEQRASLASQGLAEILGVARSTPVEGQKLIDLLTLAAASDQKEELAALRGTLDHLKPDRPSAIQHLLTSKGECSLQIEMHPLDDRHHLVAIEDVTGADRSKKDVYSLAYQDHLTGIANRSSFERRLDEALIQIAAGYVSQASVIFLDLDRFKAVNDTLGHEVGDSLLRLVSQRLRSALRDSDFAARLGGDEFAILLGGSPEASAVAELATRIIDLLQRPYLVDGHVLNVSASLGIALAPVDGATRNQLLRCADLALYHSKRNGRGIFTFFRPVMEERAQERRALELDLRKALLLRQFELHYQPQINVETQRVIGMEGLLRWRHPKRGLLLPAEFLPLAEEIGLGVVIGEWVLKSACKEASQWPDGIVAAINISPLHFESKTFAESVERVLEATGLDPARLEIEVTEDVLLRNGTNVLQTLGALHELGVRVAMDSFGTGIASLGQLVNFPFDKIKIDRSLISGNQHGRKGRALVLAISALGQSLGIVTLAEGVETREHLADVRSDGCSHVQGFYYSHAVPARDIPALLARQLP